MGRLIRARNLLLILSLLVGVILLVVLLLLVLVVVLLLLLWVASSIVFRMVNSVVHGSVHSFSELGGLINEGIHCAKVARKERSLERA
jgi:hypothetical protein